MRGYLILFFFIWRCEFSDSQCLVASYKLNGNCSDSIGRLHGSGFAVSYVQDRFGKANSAAHFDANQNSHITLPASTLNFPNYSYALWVRLTDYPSSGSAFIFLSIGSSGGDQNFQIENNQDNAALGYFTGFSITGYNVNGVLRGGTASGVLPSKGDWNHVVCTRDSFCFSIYVNGCLVKRSASNFPALPSYGNGPLSATIGCRSNQTVYFDGDLDDVKIFNCALNDTQITKLYNDQIKLTIDKDTSICINDFKPFVINTNGKYCSYQWFKQSDRSKVIGTGSALNISEPVSECYMVRTNSGDSAIFKLIIHQPTPKTLRDTSFCGNGSVKLQVEGKGIFQWSNGEVGKTITVSHSGTYSVQYLDSHLCLQKDTAVVTVDAEPRLELKDTFIFCKGEKLSYNLPLTYHYFWDNGDTVSVISVSKSEIRTLKISNGSCVKLDTICFVEMPRAHAGFSYAPALIYLDSMVVFNNKASNFDRLYYDFGDGTSSIDPNPGHRYTQAGKFMIKQVAENNNGCNDTFSLSLEIFDLYFTFLPNAFTPDNNGLNEVFTPWITGGSEYGYNFSVYNRWGELIFNSQIPGEGWDGTYQGEWVEQGVYFFCLDLRAPNRGRYNYRGTFTLLR